MADINVQLISTYVIESTHFDFLIEDFAIFLRMTGGAQRGTPLIRNVGTHFAMFVTFLIRSSSDKGTEMKEYP